MHDRDFEDRFRRLEVEPPYRAVCGSSGKEIGLERLRARPGAEFCIDCKDDQKRLERQAE